MRKIYKSLDFRKYETEVWELKNIDGLEAKNSQLLQHIDQLKEKYKGLLANIFTFGQIKKLVDADKRICWSSEHIGSAIALRSVSPKAYQYVWTNNYPLSAMSTLRCWVPKVDVSEKILKPVVTIIKRKPPILVKWKEFVCLPLTKSVYQIK